MKIIKKVTVFVMGLVVIGVVATTIGVVTRTKNVEKSVTFELLENGELAFNVYDTLYEYAVFDGSDVINLINWTVNGDSSDITEPYVSHNNNGFEIYDNFDDQPNIFIFPDSTYSTTNLNVGDIISITFAVEVKTPVIIKTLLLLTPLILSASLIGYLSLSVKKGDE